MADIKFLRLISGEELIAEIAKQNAEFVTLKDQVAVIVRMDPTTNPPQAKLALQTWLAYTKAKDGVEISRNHILFMTEPSDDLKQNYQAAMGKIVAVEKPKLIVPGK